MKGVVACVCMFAVGSVNAQGENYQRDQAEKARQHTLTFGMFDTNGDMVVDASETKDYFMQTGQMMTQDDISAFFIASDKNEDGVINLDEYLAASLKFDEGLLSLADFKFQ